MEEVMLLGGILVCQLVIIGGLMYALKHLSSLVEHTEKLEAIAENLENIQLLNRLDDK